MEAAFANYIHRDAQRNKTHSSTSVVQKPNTNTSASDDKVDASGQAAAPDTDKKRVNSEHDKAEDYSDVFICHGEHLYLSFELKCIGGIKFRMKH